MPRVQVGKHTVEMTNNPLTGMETVKYDGVIKSKAFTFAGRSHMFTVDEEEETVTYEVEFRSGFFSMHFTVRRNGVAVFTS